MHTGSVSNWIDQLKAGDREATQQLWERYFRRMMALARKHLEPALRGATDEEDIALSAFASFCRRLEEGKFPQLCDRDQLWHLLLTITLRKVCKLAQHEGHRKRDWRRTHHSSELPEPESGSSPPDWLHLIGSEPDPAFSGEVAEQCQRLLHKLNNSQLERIALRKMEGYTNQEIADELDCAVPTIERRLRLIRKCWENDRREPR